MKNLIEETLKNNISNPAAFFVFPTQMAADLWADRIISVSDVTAVAMERFLAWDTFKGNSIKSRQQNKKAIPSILRKIFTDRLIEQNGEEPFLKNLIIPQYAKSAAGFSDWISSILTGLETWKKYFEKSGSQADSEDQDLLEIYNRYKDFLETHNLFEPAWETPPFEADGHHYFIFFPEILSDYTEYEEILRTSEDITIINLPESPDYVKPSADFYNNTRTEIKALALNLLDLHQNKKIPWDEIAVNVPDLDTDGTYIHRELRLYQIPHVMRYAKPLTSFGAGSFFNQLSECISGNFNYDSIKNLLLNTSLPWKNPKLNSSLVAYGQSNNCICSFKYEGQLIDIWEKSFGVNKPDAAIREHYYSLKKDIERIVKANSFEKIRDNYFIFRGNFFDMDNCPAETDLVISRCISELGNLIDIQNSPDFADCTLKDPYTFFVNYLNGTKYLAQATTCGVQVIPYRMAATAPYSVHYIVDSTQASLSVIYKPLSFLRDDKRKMLFGQKEDPNVTEKMIKLYQMNSVNQEVYFSAAAKTFTGYSQVSSYLEENSLIPDAKKGFNPKLFEKDKNNTFADEAEWFLNEKKAFPEKITETAKEGFDFWSATQTLEDTSTKDFSMNIIKNRIENTRYKNGNLFVSYSTLNQYYSCPRKWLINSVSKLNQQDNEAVLMDVFEKGNLNHKILELYFHQLSIRNIAIYLKDNELTEDCDEILNSSIKEAIETEKISFLEREQLWTMMSAIYSSIKSAVVSFSKTFLGYTVFDVEREFNYINSEKKIHYNGRVDLLLQEPGSGDLTLVDFKSSDYSVPDNIYIEPSFDEEGNPLPVPESLEEQSLPAFQMPFYIFLMNMEKKPLKVENCCYFSIKSGTVFPVAGEKEFLLSIGVSEKKLDLYKSMEAFNQEVEKTIECAENFAKRIEASDFSTNKLVQTFSVCNSCDYRALCRKVFNVSRK